MLAGARDALLISPALSEAPKNALFFRQCAFRKAHSRNETITMGKKSLFFSPIFQEAHGQPVVAVEFSPDPATSNLFATVGRNQVRR